MSLPDDLHQLALSVARDQSQTLSEVIVLLIRAGLRADEPASADLGSSSVTGLPTIRFGRPITTEDVRALEDD